MFSDEVSVMVANITHDQMERDEAEIALVKLTCEINPLTPQRAEELDDFVRGTLFTRTGAEVNDKLGSVSFRLAMPPQQIQVRMAPDQKKPSFTIDEAKIENWKAKRSKKSSAWTLEFMITCAPASEHQLAQIVECYLKTKYLTFTPAEPGLFDETPEVKGRRQSEAEEEAGKGDDIDVPEGAPAH